MRVGGPAKPRRRIAGDDRRPAPGGEQDGLQPPDRPSVEAVEGRVEQEDPRVHRERADDLDLGEQRGAARVATRLPEHAVAAPWHQAQAFVHSDLARDVVCPTLDVDAAETGEVVAQGRIEQGIDPRHAQDPGWTHRHVAASDRNAVEKDLARRGPHVAADRRQEGRRAALEGSVERDEGSFRHGEIEIAKARAGDPVGRHRQGPQPQFPRPREMRDDGGIDRDVDDLPETLGRIAGMVELRIHEEQAGDGLNRPTREQHADRQLADAEIAGQHAMRAERACQRGHDLSRHDLGREGDVGGPGQRLVRGGRGVLQGFVAAQDLRFDTEKLDQAARLEDLGQERRSTPLVRGLPAHGLEVTRPKRHRGDGDHADDRDRNDDDGPAEQGHEREEQGGEADVYLVRPTVAGKERPQPRHRLQPVDQLASTDPPQGSRIAVAHLLDQQVPDLALAPQSVRARDRLAQELQAEVEDRHDDQDGEDRGQRVHGPVRDHEVEDLEHRDRQHQRQEIARDGGRRRIPVERPTMSERGRGGSPFGLSGHRPVLVKRRTRDAGANRAFDRVMNIGIG